MPPLFTMNLAQIKLAVESAKERDPAERRSKQVTDVFAERTRKVSTYTGHDLSRAITVAVGGDPNRCGHCGQRHGSEDQARSLNFQVQAMAHDIERLQAQVAAPKQDITAQQEEEYKLMRGRTIILED